MTIKEIRATTGLNQSEFAAHFGINVRALQNWEIAASLRRLICLAC